MKTADSFLTDAQLRVELERCIQCEEKPCQEACPADCSPADFIRAALVGAKSDFRRSAALILGSNPLGGVCGVVCPDYFCMKACARRTFDQPINIPAVQATIVEKAKNFGLSPFQPATWNGKKIAIIGAGPAGLGAAGVLAQLGYRVTVFEKRKQPGGMTNLIPEFRLQKRVLRTDLDFVRRLGTIQFKTAKAVSAPAVLLAEFDAVIVSAGLDEPLRLGITGEEKALAWQVYLERQKQLSVRGKKVAVLGGGAVAADCAMTAKRRGALSVELIYRRRQHDMPLTPYERRLLLKHGIEIASGTKPLAIIHKGGRVKGIRLARLTLAKGRAPRPANFVVNPKESPFFREFDVVISAIGSRSHLPVTNAKGVFYAGDIVLGSSTVVEAVASGKNAAREADEFIRVERSTDISVRKFPIGGRNARTKMPALQSSAKSCEVLAGINLHPVPLGTDFFGRAIRSPFLLSAAPHTDGYAQMRKAYEQGWAGGVMKTAFDNVPIHIPSEYMFALTRTTYGNCDNVSGHPLDRVCREVEQLVKEFPDRLTLASTGGPVTGRDEADKAVWQANTRKLQAAGAMGVEYSLSCPQGGDGAEGDVVSQNAALTAKIISWVLEASDGGNPKLFKLTGAVTSIQPILRAIQEVFARYPDRKAGVTLANSFPALAFRPSLTRRWEEGVVIGMSGEGVLPISNLTLAKAAAAGLTISGNGGAMNYKDAANFLALGAQTVQFCTAVMKNGLGYVADLHSGLSFLLEERGFRSVGELIGSALPNPIADFVALPATKKLPQVVAAMCQHCGNCERCPYQAITLNALGVPVFEAALCVGCSLCAQKCFAGAISMRDRTARELAAFSEA